VLCVSIDDLGVSGSIDPSSMAIGRDISEDWSSSRFVGISCSVKQLSSAIGCKVFKLPRFTHSYHANHYPDSP
jgi:hypothetical protein